MDKYEVLRSGLQELISKMQELVSNGEYGEDEKMESKDVKDVMSDVEEDMGEMKPQESPIHGEMMDFFKKKNLGSRPKGLKAVMVEAKVAKPSFDMGFKKQGKR